MKKVINGKLYDSETAILIDTAVSTSQSEHRSYSETLYKTPKGNFFLVGHGGPQTRWAQQTEEGVTSYGYGLIAIKADDALAWCEENNTEALLIMTHFDVDEA